MSNQDKLYLPAALQHFIQNLSILKRTVSFKNDFLYVDAVWDLFYELLPPAPLPALLWIRRGVPKTESTFFH